MNNHVRYHVTVGAVTLDVEIDAEGILVDGDRILATGPELAGSNVYSFLVDGASHTVLAERGASGVWDLQLRGQRHRVEVMDERTKVMRNMNSAAPDLQGPLPVRAPMPGLVVKVEVQEGDLVEAGRGLLVVEAMKMQNEIRAQVAGVVKAVHVQAGDAVPAGAKLIEFAESEPPS